MGQTEHKKSLAETVADNLIEYIVNNHLQAGDKIKNEFELASELGVGRGTVREAVKILVSRNILEIKRGYGTFVSGKQGIVEDPLGLMFIGDKSKLALDLLSVRFMIEPEIAGIAAQNASIEQIKEIESQCDLVEQMILSNIDHTQEDVKFHTLIAHSSGNIVVEKLVPIINSSVILFANITHLKLRKETIETHREIVDCMKDRDSDGAKYAMNMHLTHNRKYIVNSLKNDDSHFSII